MIYKIGIDASTTQIGVSIFREDLLIHSDSFGRERNLTNFGDIINELSSSLAKNIIRFTQAIPLDANIFIAIELSEIPNFGYGTGQKFISINTMKKLSVISGACVGVMTLLFMKHTNVVYKLITPNEWQRRLDTIGGDRKETKKLSIEHATKISEKGLYSDDEADAINIGFLADQLVDGLENSRAAAEKKINLNITIPKKILAVESSLARLSSEVLEQATKKGTFNKSIPWEEQLQLKEHKDKYEKLSKQLIDLKEERRQLKEKKQWK